ncbi:MAG: nicotinate-nucleotide adenylyltransferase [Firmicutes bacterium]|jgi:nicotinate-nucleotide adenylyltransferase|nr:nicotinate-nucleotide adenylyltransferase [Bacillota bacterium]NLL88331.1 nicotinate-nucleotide adenylyltransferase [Bacillota bacterium]HKM17742.1 nicotinate-nucleotide adenylyltransferase [Limnochordia bacterium]
MVTKFKPWKIGIMGGTFDPIHYGHLVTAEIVRGEFSIDRVLFVPSGLPPHKDPRLVSHMEHRYLMTVFATLTNPYFEVSRVDIDRGRETYTIDTLRDLRMLYGEQVDLYFITGADAIAGIMGWKDAAELVQLAEFVAATRPGYRFECAVTEWFEQHGKKLHLLQVPAMAISSTDIRRRVQGQKSIRYLVPEAVEHYIHKNGLYLQQYTHSMKAEDEDSNSR